MNETFPRVLVILPNNLGDVIMATPVLEGIKATYPQSYIAFLVEEGFQSGVSNNPHCDEVIQFPRRRIRDGLATPDWTQQVDALQAWVASVNERQFDWVINLCQHNYISYLVSLITADKKVGKIFLREGIESLTDPWSQYLYAIPFARRFNRLHATDVYRRIAGAMSHHGGYTISLSADEITDARFLLDDKGFMVDGGNLAVFQPGAAFPSKRWPAEHFVTLGKMLIGKGWKIILSGAPAEQDVCTAIASQLGGSCLSIAGDVSFRQAMAVLSLSRACVTGDTALMHAAAALGVRTYALFGPTSPAETGPYGDNHWVLCGMCPDKPCFCETCKNMLCMKSILPQAVFGCITDDTPGPNPKCEAYLTALQPDGDYSLVPHGSYSCSYYDIAGAFFTLKVFDNPPEQFSVSDDLLDPHREESRQVLSMVTNMGRLLKDYTIRKDIARIRAFEKAKDQLAELRGIGAFWAALLNIKLNSIPLLDAQKGLAETVSVCEQFAEKLKIAVKKTVDTV